MSIQQTIILACVAYIGTSSGGADLGGEEITFNAFRAVPTAMRPVMDASHHHCNPDMDDAANYRGDTGSGVSGQASHANKTMLGWTGDEVE
jgi:hypothetical protein